MGRRIIETVVEYKPQPACKTPEQMEQICCETTEKLQCCEKYDGTWQGHTAQDLLGKYHPNLDAQGRDSSGRYVVIELAPRKNPCGEKVIEYDVSGGNCCDEVLALDWDYDATADVLPSGGSVSIFVSGGRGPYTFTTTNAETHFDNGSRSITSDVGHARLLATDDFCGATEVTVSDGCTSVSEFFRSDIGYWQELPDGDCVLPAVPVPDEPELWHVAPSYNCYLHEQYAVAAVVDRGRYKQAEGAIVDCTWPPDGSGNPECNWLDLSHSEKCAYGATISHPAGERCLGWHDTLQPQEGTYFSVCSPSLFYSKQFTSSCYDGEKNNYRIVFYKVVRSGAAASFIWVC